MTDQIPTSRGKRRLLLAGAGVGGPLIGLLLLLTVFGGDEVAVGVAPAPVPNQAQSTTVPVPTTVRDDAPVLAATSDPFRQLVTVPDPTQSTGATPIVGSAGKQPAIDGARDAGVAARAPSTDDPLPPPVPPPVSGEPPPVSGEPPPVSDETVSQAAAPETFSSPPTTELPVPTSSMSSPSATATTTTTAPSSTVGAPERGVVFAGVRDGNQDIYTIDPVGGGERRLTYGRAADRDPAWSPDGTRIAFVSERAWRPEIFVMGADGTAQVRVTTNGESPARPTWGSDSDSLLFESTDVATGSRELSLLTLRTGVVRRLTSGACAGSAVRLCPHGDIAHGQPAPSPDGTRIAFVRTDRTGQHLLAMNADGSDIGSLGGIRAANPAWAADGRTIAYDDVDGIRVVSADGGGHEVVAATPGVCTPVTWCPVWLEPSWSPDGARLAVRDGNAGTTTGNLYVIDLLGRQQTPLIAAAQASGARWFSPSRAVGGTP